MPNNTIDWRASYRQPVKWSEKDMGRTRMISDPDLGCLVEVGNGSNHPPPEKLTGPKGCIGDIAPYQPVAANKETGVRPDYIGGRRQHREFLRDNGYIEVGNSFVKNRQEHLSKSDRVADLKRAMGD